MSLVTLLLLLLPLLLAPLPAPTPLEAAAGFEVALPAGPLVVVLVVVVVGVGVLVAAPVLLPPLVEFARAVDEPFLLGGGSWAFPESLFKRTHTFSNIRSIGRIKRRRGSPGGPRLSSGLRDHSISSWEKEGVG